MGAFDDLVPGPSNGAFDDLIPAAPATAAGAFDDLIPAAPSPSPGTVAQVAPPALPSPAVPLYAGQPAPPAESVQAPLARMLDPARRPLPAAGPIRLPDARTAPAAAQNVVGPAPTVTAEEFGGILESVRNGLTLTPEQDAALRLRLPPDGVKALDEAQQVARWRTTLPADSPLVPGGPAVEAFLNRAVSGATLNMLPPAQAPAGVPGATALNTARELQAEQQVRQHPVAALGGDVAGAVAPYMGAGLALRSAQHAAAAGRSPVARSIARLLGPAAQEGKTASLVREGATLAAPIEFARKPEGAGQMTASEELAVRGTQAVVGAGLGAAGDALLMGVVAPLARRGGMLARDFWAVLRDKRTAAALDAEAKQAGFDGAESYIESATQTVAGPDGREVVVPNADILRRLPGPDGATPDVPAAPDAPTPEAPDTLAAQWQAFADGRKPGVLLTPGEVLPDVLPAGAKVAEVPGRGTLIYRDEATLAAAQSGRMGEALGYGVDEKPPGASTVVTARDADGRVVQDVVTDGRPQVQAAAEQAAGPQGTVEERTAAAALEERQLRTRAAELDRLATQTANPDIKLLLQQEAQRARDLATGTKPKLTPAERARERLRVDWETDDLLTIIRKMGGLNVDSGDWRGYLNPVAGRVPGLPNPEQTGGRGMLLDDLAQRLWEQGWIPEHNLQLVEDLLDRARTGERLYHPHSDKAAQMRLEAERDREEGMAWQSASTDDDWTFDLPDVPADRGATGFVIDNEAGAVVPARPVTLDDLERIDAEERAADDWFRREAGGAGPDEFAGGLAGDGALGVPDGPPGALQGRAGDQPAAGDVAGGADRPRAAGGGQLDLAGLPARNETAQAVADRGRAVDARLSGGGRDVPIDAGPGGLFSAKARNLDLLDDGAPAGAFDDLIPPPAPARAAEPLPPERTLKVEPAAAEPAPVAPADPLNPAQRRSYERLREAADFEPETLTTEQWGILDNLQRKLTGAGEAAPGGRAARREATAAEREQLARDFDEGATGTAADLEAESGARRPTAGAGDTQPVAQPRAPQVRYEPVDSLPTATRTVTTGEDVAHLAAALRRDAQESVLAVVTDEAGQVLRVARVSRGGVGSAPVDPRVAAGAATSTPDGRRVWFVHNHPAGDAAQSPADAELLGYLSDLLRGSGVEARGMVTVAPGGRAAVLEPGAPERAVTIPAGRRGERVPVEERRLRGQHREAPVAADELHQALPAEDGVMLFSGDGRPARWVPMSADDMRLLRRGEGGPGQRLMRAVDESNAERLAARVTHAELGDAAAGNVRAFARQMGLADDGALDAAGRRLGDGSGQATFYANPFLAGAKPIWRELTHAPGRAGVSAAAGGAIGGTLSEADPGSAQWWLDVATGAAVGAGGMAALRTLGVTGKGAILDSWRARAGRWMSDWLWGNLDVRAIKRQADLMRQMMDRQTAQVGKVLAERFTPTERAKMADLIEGRGIVRDFNAVHAQAAALEDYLTAAAERMKALGMLPPDLETGGYLHRYYAKHLGLDSAFREAKAQSLSASYSRARGMEEAFGAEYLSPGARTLADELAQVQADIDRLGGAAGDLVDADTRTRLDALRDRRRELRKAELVECLGVQDGKPQRFFFARNEVPRVPGEDGRAVLAQLHQPRPGEMARPDRLPDIEGVTDLSPTGRVWSPTGARRPGQKAGAVLLHRDWTKAERERWGEITDAGYRYVRGMAEVSHDVATATVFKTVADKAEWARAADPGPWLNPPAGKRRYKGKAWVKVPEARVGPRSPLKRYGALSGMYVRPDVWDALKRYGAPVFEMPKGTLTVPAGAALGAAYGAAAGPLGAFGGAVAGAGIGALASRELYRHWLAHWKAWKTVYNPVTHLNNTHSNVQMLLMAGYSPADLGDGMRHLWHGEQSELWREARDAGLFGTDWASTILGNEGGTSRSLLDLAEQLRQQSDVIDGVLVTDRVMRAKQWLVESRQAVRDAAGPWQTGAELARAAGVPALKGLKTAAVPVKVLAKAAENLYRFEDDVFKMAVFSAARKKGMTPRQAVEEANAFYFDYRDVPDAVRFARDLPIGSPFITYTYKVIPAIARNIAQNPERVLALIAGYEAMNYAGQLTDGGQPGEYWATAAADEELSPPWEDGRSLWGARNTVRLPFLDGYRLALGRAHAAGNPFAAEAGGRTVLATPDALNGVWGPALYGSSPLAAVMDLLTNQDWRGKPIYDAGAPKAEQAQAMAVYLYQAWTPSNILTPGSYHQGKVLEGMANDVRQAQEEGRAPPVLAPIVDLANGLAADLGVQGFTGLDRGGNDIRTRDALLGSFGVKVRPVRAEDSLDIELSQLDREMSEAKRWIKAQGRLAADGRITDGQYDDNLQQYDQQIEQLGREKERLLDAMDRLRAAGVTVQVKE